MDLFETQYSTLSSSALNKYLQNKYQLKNTTCKYLLRGVSDTYQLEGEEHKFIFKVYRKAHRSLAEIEGEVELLNILKEQGAKVAFPIRDSEGGLIQAFRAAEGTRYGVLFHFAEGKVIYNLTEEQLTTLGREMAFNHNITAKIKLRTARQPYSLQTTVLEPLRVLEPAFTGYPEGYEYLEMICEKVSEKMEAYTAASFSYGYCHYDYLPKNFHFDDNNHLTLFDFDFAGQGYLVNDLMSFQVHYFFHVIIKGMPPKEAERDFTTFVQGYREVREIAEEELDLIPYLGVGYWMFYLAYHYTHYDDWSNTFFNLQHLQKWIGWMKKWEALYCKF